MRDADSYRSARKRKAKELGITVEQLEARQRLADWAKGSGVTPATADAMLRGISFSKDGEHVPLDQVFIEGGSHGRR